MKDQLNNVAEITINYSLKIKATDRMRVLNSMSAYNIFKPLFSDFVEHREGAYALFLNRANKVLGSFMLSIGGVSGTILDPKLLFQAALKANASGIMVAHNHPSGSLVASEADKKMSKKIKQGGELLDINLIDFLILSDSKYLSFADDNLL